MSRVDVPRATHGSLVAEEGVPLLSLLITQGSRGSRSWINRSGCGLCPGCWFLSIGNSDGSLKPKKGSLLLEYLSESCSWQGSHVAFGGTAPCRGTKCKALDSVTSQCRAWVLCFL